MEHDNYKIPDRVPVENGDGTCIKVDSIDASYFLNRAKDIVTGNRNKMYEKPERNFGAIADFWSLYLEGKGVLERSLTPEDVGIMMALLKISRIMSGTQQPDSYVDACGYMAISGELAAGK